MKLSSALCLALALGWARENASYTPFAIPRGRRHAAFSGKALSLSSSPHPPDEPPPNALLNLYFASTPNQNSSADQPQQQPAEPEQEDEPEQLQELEPSFIQELSTTTPEPSPLPEPTPPPTYVPAKPWMTEEQKEEINAAANRFLQDVWKPLFESSVQTGVPADTIKGAALVGATLAFLASKGLVVTSAAGLSAAYVAISQGVAGDVLRTMGGIAWDVTESASKLLQMATTNDSMTGLSKELVDKVTLAVKETQSRATALQELGENSSTNTNTNTNAADVQQATEAFLESQDELARVLREAENAIGAADAAIAQAEQTLWQDQLDTTSSSSTKAASPLTVDISVPYNAAAKLAYEASDKSIPFEDFKPKYLAESIALVKSKQQQASKKLLEQAKQKMEQEEAKRKAAEEEEKARLAAELKEAKQKVAEEEKARIAAEQEDAKRKAAEEEKTRVAAEQEAKRIAAETEKARIAAELEEAKRKATEEEKARIAAEQEEAKRKAAEEEKARVAAEQAKRIAAEEEKARIAAEQEAKQIAAEAEKARIAAELEEAKRIAAEQEKARIAVEKEAKRKAAEEENARIASEKEAKQKAASIDNDDGEEEEDDDDDWLAAVEMAQQGIEGKIVGLDDAIRDESGKAKWNAAGALAQELGAFDDDDDDDDDDDSLDLAALGRAARAAVEKFEAKRGIASGVQDDEDEEEDEDDDELDDLFDVDSLEELGLAARKAVEEFEEDDFEDEENDDGVKGIDGMYVASSSSSSSGRSSSSPSSAARPPIQRDWSGLTVAKLKDELKFRGLKAYGKKSELVAMLEAYDREQFGSRDNVFADDDNEEDDTFLASGSDSEDELLDLGDLDLEELGRQARAAVELGTLGGFDAEEPSDEVLMQLESEESLLLSDFLGAGKNNEKPKQKDYSGLTVLELKEELRERGLPLSGKKSELIERLQATDLS